MVRTDESTAVLGCLRFLHVSPGCRRALAGETTANRHPQHPREHRQRGLLVPLLLHLQVCLLAVAVPANLPVSVAILSECRKQADSRLTREYSGAELIFRSVFVPTFGRYFSQGSTASNLRAKADSAAKAD